MKKNSKIEKLLSSSASELTVEQLEEVLAEKKKALIPVPLSEPDYKDLFKYVVDYVNSDPDQRDHGDDEHYIFEAAIESIYGRSIWDYLNKS